MGSLNSNTIKIQALGVWRSMSYQQTFGLTPVAVLGRWKRYLLSVSALLDMECVQARLAWQIS